MLYKKPTEKILKSHGVSSRSKCGNPAIHLKRKEILIEKGGRKLILFIRAILSFQAEESIGEEMEAAKGCKRRLEHLKELDTLSSAAANQWKKKRLDRMLVEYFLRAGYYNTAIRLAKHSDIEVNSPH